MNTPHGLKLIHRVLCAKERLNTLKEKDNLVSINIDIDTVREVENIAYGVYSPLGGFQGKEDFKSILDRKRLSNDLAWTIPIVFDLDKELSNKLPKNEPVLFCYRNTPVALFNIKEKFGFLKKDYAKKVYGTCNLDHPGVKRINNMKDVLVSGQIDLINPTLGEFKNYYLHPKQTRNFFKEKGWNNIAAFQTRNVPHLGHEYVQKTALTISDGLFINPMIGPKKTGDFTDNIIIKSYLALIKNYYPKDNVIMSILKSKMHYAGPREAIHHAIMRKNFGCTHFIVGRDHAGVGNYYQAFAAHKIFDEFPDLGIIPLFFRSFSRCKKCNQIVNDKICPHPDSDHINFSGTRIRNLLKEGKIPPPDLMRSEVAKVILDSKNIFID